MCFIAGFCFAVLVWLGIWEFNFVEKLRMI
jgi:hypothetical protein